MLFDVFRMVPQQKALHCYIILTIWILILITGVYKFWEPKEKKLSEPPVPNELFHNLALDVKTKKIFKICNLPEEIAVGDEGATESKQWTLEGLIILTRHGDRGPLQHVKNISSVNCGTKYNALFSLYKNYLNNITLSGKVSWVGPGPFHGFPLLPTHLTQCQLGQLTMQGIQQLLKLGQSLKQRYAKIWPKLLNLTHADVNVYSTRYRRTFQSALALLYSLIPAETLNKLSIEESQSMNFCFRDCGCPVTDKYARIAQQAVDHQLKSHPAVALLAETTGRSVFSQNSEQSSLSTDPHVLRDALLTYVCHGSSLPCETPFNCVKRQNVAGIFAYTDWVNYQKRRNIFWMKLCLLRSYGLIKHMVQQMLRMVSNSSPSLILYSGHDHTLEQFATALGLPHDPILLRYAARMVLEVYQNHAETTDTGAGAIYFRLLANGKDVTNRVSFCKHAIVNTPNEIFCKIEDIVRFIHDDYFVRLNGTNFKDACTMKD